MHPINCLIRRVWIPLLSCGLISLQLLDLRDAKNGKECPHWLWSSWQPEDQSRILMEGHMNKCWKKLSRFSSYWPVKKNTRSAPKKMINDRQWIYQDVLLSICMKQKTKGCLHFFILLLFGARTPQMNTSESKELSGSNRFVR